MATNEQTPYGYPYIDSSVFISLVMGETIVTSGGGTRVEVAEHLFSQIEETKGHVVTSALTIAEVHKLKSSTVRRTEPQDDRLIEFFQRSFIQLVDVDRGIAEEANKFCRRFGLMPCDAIHLASALRAGCDVLLSWDGRFNKVKHPKIRVEEPTMKGQLVLKVETV